jgi:hypothetical protein
VQSEECQTQLLILYFAVFTLHFALALSLPGIKASTRPRRLRLPPSGQGGRLTDPRCHLRLVEIVFVDVDPARVLVRASGRNGAKRRASEEAHFDEVREGMETEEPALAREAIEG